MEGEPLTLSASVLCSTHRAAEEPASRSASRTPRARGGVAQLDASYECNKAASVTFPVCEDLLCKLQLIAAALLSALQTNLGRELREQVVRSVTTAVCLCLLHSVRLGGHSKRRLLGNPGFVFQQL